MRRASRWRMSRTSRRAKSSQRAEEMVVELPVMNRTRRRGREGAKTNSKRRRAGARRASRLITVTYFKTKLFVYDYDYVYEKLPTGASPKPKRNRKRTLPLRKKTQGRCLKVEISG